MASTTFLELTNRVLRKLNEVELTASNFDSARGVHAAVKDAVNDSVDEINKVGWEWPFNAVLHTQTLTVGVEEYAWPASVSFKAADWDSFQIHKDDSLNVKNKHLKKINRAQWYQYLKDRDDDSDTLGLNTPEVVLPTHGIGFALSPSPDQAYEIEYRYYKNPARMTTHDSFTTIPSEYDYIIQTGALHTMYFFLDNDERSALMGQKFHDSIKQMRRLLVPEDFYMTSGVMNVGGGAPSYSNIFFGET